MSYLKDRLSPSLFVESVPVEVEPKTFTPDLKGLIAWLEIQSPTRTYDFGSSQDCLLCRFVSAIAGEPVNFSEANAMLLQADRISLYRAAYGGYRAETSYAEALSNARAELVRSCAR